MKSFWIDLRVRSGLPQYRCLLRCPSELRLETHESRLNFIQELHIPLRDVVLDEHFYRLLEFVLDEVLQDKQ